jgi:heme oxygenase
MVRHTAADEGTPLRARLRAATVELHHALEARLDLLSPHLSKERYRRLLVGLHGYYSAIEPRLVSLAKESRAPLGVLVRSGLLERDLISLGLSHATVAEGPRCQELPTLRVREHLAGCLYVLEGSRLGSKLIARAVERHLGISCRRGCSFFAGEGEPLKRRWQEVLSWIERLAAEPAVDLQKIVLSAVETFGSFERWLAAVGAFA